MDLFVLMGWGGMLARVAGGGEGYHCGGVLLEYGRLVSLACDAGWVDVDGGFEGVMEVRLLGVGGVVWRVSGGRGKQWRFPRPRRMFKEPWRGFKGLKVKVKN